MAIVTAHVAAVQELYVAYFNRPADVAGLDYWTNVVEAQGGETAAVSASFATQPEYIVAFYNLTNAQIVDKIYLNMFGRGASTTDGRAYWVDLLNKGSVTVDVIVAEVAGGAQGTDSEAVENKVAAATAFTSALDTDAEQAGYAGEAALTAAKAFITGVTTDATLTTAIAPAALAATVAAVVKAGTPFSLTSALTSLEDAVEARADFLEENELSAVPATAKTALEGKVATESAALDLLVEGTYYVAAPGTPVSAGVQAALLADQQKANTTELTNATKALNTANAEAAAVTGLSAAIANKRAAADALVEATEAAEETEVTLDIAEASFNRRAETTVEITLPADDAVTGTVVVAMADPEGEEGDTIDLIVTNARGNLVLNAAAGVTEEDFPGITALRDALIADIDADSDLALATTAATTAANEAILKTEANAPIVGRVEAAVLRVENAEKAIDALADAVADRAEAVAMLAEFNALNTAVTDAQDAFGANGFKTPVALNDDAAATSGSDIFMIGTDENVTISSFGRTGNDALFVGTQYKVGTDLDEGDNSAMEVFFVQNGTRTEVHVEQAAYGSDSDDVTIITLVGVDADDLQLVNGIVSLKAGAGA